MKLKIRKSASEEILIKKCLNGDIRAQRDLFDRYASPMLGICFRYVSGKMEAEDVMITGFKKAFDNLNTYSGTGSFRGWLRRIMINEALTYLRRNKNMYLEVDIEIVDEIPNFPKHQELLGEEEMMAMIQDLPVGYRTVFNLYAIEGYSHKEIAGILGININTSKSQLSRARSILQNKLLEKEKEYKALNHGRKGS